MHGVALLAAEIVDSTFETEHTAVWLVRCKQHTQVSFRGSTHLDWNNCVARFFGGLGGLRVALILACFFPTYVWLPIPDIGVVHFFVCRGLLGL